jgi:hypothetical protein
MDAQLLCSRAVVTSRRFNTQQHAVKKTITRIVIISNAILYILFIIIVIAYQYAEPTVTSGTWLCTHVRC